MSAPSLMDPASVREAKLNNPKMRERDLAGQLGISEAQYLEAWIGETVERLNPDIDTFFDMLTGAGPVMALSRNDSAVHEKTGIYENFKNNKHAAMVLGADIDLRLFPKHWKHAYHVEKKLEGGKSLNSFQFFDASGTAVHKVFTRDNTNLDRWNEIRTALKAASDAPSVFEAPKPAAAGSALLPAEQLTALREDWAALQDTHGFRAMLRKHKIERLDAIRLVGEEFAEPLDHSALEILFNRLPADKLPVMIFVRNDGILQIHSGGVSNIKSMGPWLNVLDEGFHLHLRTDHIASTWIVRKPSKRGDIFSVEAFDANGNQIILINGYRREGDHHEAVAQWDQTLRTLPRPQTNANSN